MAFVKISTSLLTAGLLMWLPAVPCVQAQGSSASKSAASGKSSGSAKKGTAAKPAAPQKTAAKPSSTAKAAGSKEKPKAVVKAPAKPAPGRDKALATAKKSKPATSAAGKPPVKTVAANSKTPARSSTKPAKSAPDKTRVVAGTKKKSKPADDAPPVKTSGAGHVAGGKKSETAKEKSPASSGVAQTASSLMDARDADGDDAGADTRDHDMFASRIFVPADLGQRFFGMPTGLPSALTFVSLMVDSTAPRTFSASNPGVAPQKRPVAPMDAMAAQAAMEASAKKQSTFRPAPASVSDRFSMPDDKTGPVAASAGPDRRQAADFVTKAAPLPPAIPTDDFSGLGDFLHSRPASLTLKGGPDGASGSAGHTGRDAGGTTVANPSARQGAHKPEAVKPPATAAVTAPPVPVRATTPASVPAKVEVKAPAVPATVPVFFKPAGNAASAAASPPPPHGEVFARSLALAATRVSGSASPEPAAEPALPRSVPTSAVLPLKVENTFTEKLPESLPAFDEPATGSVEIQSAGRTEHDQRNNKVIYTGRVELNDKVVHLRGDRVEVFLKKNGNGIERLEASGHVMLRTLSARPGSGRMASAGRVIYHPATGEITLREKPEVREGGKGGKSHVSTSPSTIMVIKSDGRILTEGPNRTLIAN